MNLIKGIANGVKSAAKSLADGVVNAAKAALDAAKDFLGINSPSTVMRDQVGKMIGLGMVEGIKDSTRLVNAAMSDLNSTLISGDAYDNSMFMPRNVSVANGALRQGDTIINVYNPQPSPSELAWQIKKNQQELALGF